MTPASCARSRASPPSARSARPTGRSPAGRSRAARSSSPPRRRWPFSTSTAAPPPRRRRRRPRRAPFRRRRRRRRAGHGGGSGGGGGGAGNEVALVVRRLRKRGWEVMLADGRLGTSAKSGDERKRMERRSAYMLEQVLPPHLRKEVGADVDLDDKVRHVAKPWERIKLTRSLPSLQTAAERFRPRRHRHSHEEWGAAPPSSAPQLGGGGSGSGGGGDDDFGGVLRGSPSSDEEAACAFFGVPPGVLDAGGGGGAAPAAGGDGRPIRPGSPDLPVEQRPPSITARSDPGLRGGSSDSDSPLTAEDAPSCPGSAAPQERVSSPSVARRWGLLGRRRDLADRRSRAATGAARRPACPHRRGRPQHGRRRVHGRRRRPPGAVARAVCAAARGAPPRGATRRAAPRARWARRRGGRSRSACPPSAARRARPRLLFTAQPPTEARACRRTRRRTPRAEGMAAAARGDMKASMWSSSCCPPTRRTSIGEFIGDMALMLQHAPPRGRAAAGGANKCPERHRMRELSPAPLSRSPHGDAIARARCCTRRPPERRARFHRERR